MFRLLLFRRIVFISHLTPYKDILEVGNDTVEAYQNKSIKDGVFCKFSRNIPSWIFDRVPCASSVSLFQLAFSFHPDFSLSMIKSSAQFYDEDLCNNI